MIAASQGYGVPATCQVLCWMLPLHYVIWCFCLLHEEGAVSLFQAACPVAMQLVRRTKTESKSTSNPVLLTRGRYHHPLLSGGSPGKLGPLLPGQGRGFWWDQENGEERRVSPGIEVFHSRSVSSFSLSPVPEGLTCPLSTAACLLPPVGSSLFPPGTS